MRGNGMWKKIKRSLAGCLAAVLVLTAAPCAVVQAGTLEESIKQKQEAISQAEKEKKKLQSSISNIKALVKELEKSKSNLETYVKELDGKLADIGEKIEALQKQISEKKRRDSTGEAGSGKGPAGRREAI